MSTRYTLCLLLPLLISSFILFFSLHSYYSTLYTSTRGDLPGVFSSERLHDMSHGPETTRDLQAFGRQRATGGQGSKLVLLFVDGLRFAAFREHAGLAALASSSHAARVAGAKSRGSVADKGKSREDEVAPPPKAAGMLAQDGKLLKLAACIPTESIPNLYALFTGLPPELSGVMGDKPTPPTAWQVATRKPQRFEFYTRRSYIQSFFDVAAMFGMTGELLASASNEKHSILTRHFMKDLMSHMSPRVEEYQSWDDGKRIAHRLIESQSDVRVLYFHDLDQAGRDGLGHDSPEVVSLLDKLASMLTHLIEGVPEDTIVALVSDHGQHDSGGHGGVSHHVRDVPFLVYRRNSGVGHTRYNKMGLPCLHCVDQAMVPLANTDVAPTLTALLGLPAPRHSAGMIISDMLPAAQLQDAGYQAVIRDLLLQQLVFVRNYLTSEKDTVGLSRVRKEARNTYFSVHSIQGLGGQARGLNHYFAERRAAIVHAQTRWNVPMAFLFLLVVVFPPYLYLLKNAVLRSNTIAPGSEDMCGVATLTWLFVASYQVVQILLFLFVFGIVYAVDRQFVWSSSQLTAAHVRSMVEPVLFFMGIPVAMLLRQLAIRVYDSRFFAMRVAHRPQRPLLDSSPVFRLQFFGTALFWNSVFVLALLATGSHRQLFMHPSLHSSRYITPHAWTLQIVVANLLLMNVALFFVLLVDNLVAVYIVYFSRDRDAMVHAAYFSDAKSPEEIQHILFYHGEIGDGDDLSAADLGGIVVEDRSSSSHPTQKHHSMTMTHSSSTPASDASSGIRRRNTKHVGESPRERRAIGSSRVGLDAPDKADEPVVRILTSSQDALLSDSPRADDEMDGGDDDDVDVRVPQSEEDGQGQEALASALGHLLAEEGQEDEEEVEEVVEEQVEEVEEQVEEQAEVVEDQPAAQQSRVDEEQPDLDL